jgi:uncharacterized membrane protein YhiD involved in acid resistance
MSGKAGIQKLMTLNPNRKEVLTLIIVFAGVLLISALAVYFIAGTGRSIPEVTRQDQPPGDAIREPSRSATPQLSDDENFVDRLFGSRHAETGVTGRSLPESMGRISLRLLLAALLGAALAFRPRKRILALKPNPFVSQTQILLAIVAAALMIIVGDNAARAFGIFAAVSVVRFRTNIRDPKEITVLLICLALGLACGVGRGDLALILALFSLIALWLLEWHEPQLVFRSMELKVTTKNVVSTQRALRQIFQKNGFDKELRAINREATEESPGSLVYSVDVSPTVSTDQISEEILSLDGGNVEGIEWDQKKSFSYLYQ